MATMVSLVSEQTVPNILAIWHFQPEKLLFVSTEKMERGQKVRDILATVNCRLKKSYKIGENAESIIVLEDSLFQCLRKLEEWIQGKEDEDFIVNLTGGTKLMSIAVFECFKNYESKMIYIPINKNEYISPFPIRTPKPPTPFEGRLSVEEYMCAYGLEVVNVDKVERCKKSALERKDISLWIVDHYKDIKDVLAFLGNELREAREKKLDKFQFKKEYFGRHVLEEEFLLRIGFHRDHRYYAKYLSKDEISYLTGGWLEEYCFNAVYGLCGKLADDVAVNIQIRNPQGHDNEFDVMFTSRNALYFIECKSMEQKHLGEKKSEGFDSFLYKIGALQKEFGLRVESYLVTNSSVIVHAQTGEIKKALCERAEQFKTQIVGPDDVIRFPDILKSRLEKASS